MDQLRSDLGACRLCADRFAGTATRHAPRPVVWFEKGAKILIAGQAPGKRVHQAGIPFADPSGDRLRGWMGVDKETFYDKSRIAIVPMAFCFPGYNAKGADLPPPKVCAETWRAPILVALQPRLTLLIGSYAQTWHLGPGTMTQRVQNWRDHAPATFCLPHPSWRNNAWLGKNPWFEAEVLPALRHAIRDVLR